MICPGAPDGRGNAAHRHHPSPPSDSELFNFFFIAPSAPSEMCAADEIFSRGKFLPFSAPPPPKKSDTHKPNGLLSDHRRRDSFDQATDRLPKEYRKLRKIPESGPEESAARSSSRSRPRWYVFVFGSVRVPAAMEMRDIKTRQWRRSARLTEPKTASDANWWGGEWRRGCWKLLRSLSCIGVDSAVAASPMSFV